jgi:DNA (cytosine-5)-methyltransferase 1
MIQLSFCYMLGTGQWRAPTFVSLFAGCGGFDLGFLQAGYRCLAAFDVDPVAVETHRANLHGIAEKCDLAAGLPCPERLRGVDVLLAGAPCQGFSTIGKREINDPRNDLLILGGRIASALKPRVFIAENVFGVLAGEHRTYWEALRGTLVAAGYQCADIRCMAHQLGVPQKRNRVIMLAWREPKLFEIKLNIVSGGQVGKSILSVDGLPNHAPKTPLPDSTIARIARHIGPGQKLSNVRAGPRAVHTWSIPEVFAAANVRPNEGGYGINRLGRDVIHRTVWITTPAPEPM